MDTGDEHGDELEQRTALRGNVRMLGRLLGEVIAGAEGEAVFDRVEAIRGASKLARSGVAEEKRKLLDILNELRNEELVPVARAFSQFLNLANIAEQHDQTTAASDTALLGGIDELFGQLKSEAVAAETVEQAIRDLDIEIVLTAHPTEITRRTLIYKHHQINRCLEQLDEQVAEARRAELERRLRELIAQCWHTNEIRAQRPTPVDEAKWGFAVIENSLWDAVPRFLQELNETVAGHWGIDLPLEYCPVHFSSWMGGDRDGNPNVTAAVSREVLLLGRWKATDLYLQEIEVLIDELSMDRCTEEFRQYAGSAREPYRAVLKHLRTKLRNTLAGIDAQLAGERIEPLPVIHSEDDLLEPLQACYRSLQDCGMGLIADGALLDTLRRVHCFGIHLVRLDFRQESSRHTEALAEVTSYLGLGNYAEWEEKDRVAFLLRELAGKRPLIPRDWSPSEDVAEVLATCEVIAEQPPQVLGGYIISMSRAASDVLAVLLLLREAGCRQPIKVAPLFETLDDLNHAAGIIEQLLDSEWYRGYCRGQQMVMIGYSDSAKDAGVMASAWAQYRAQEELIEVCRRAGVSLTLFHGRGGTIGRGGAPAHAALLSQPPGSLGGGLRVTEQGEMIRFKFGFPALAVNSLRLYTGAVLHANLLPPPGPEAEWREVMDELADISCRAYRKVVKDDPSFIDYFTSATPLNELAMLPLGSRPAKRRAAMTIDNLRAIPWVFAWSQNRLMLPAWLGAGEALQALIGAGRGDVLEQMSMNWPFFTTRLSMLEMVFAKSDIGLSAHYDELLVDPALRPMGEALREQLKRDIDTVLAITRDEDLMGDFAWIKESVRLRNIYSDPINLLQAELLRRHRRHESEPVRQGLVATITGIAAAMRNTG